MITVNGQPREVPPGTAVATVVAELVGSGTGAGTGAGTGTGTGAGAGRGVAVAVNGDVVPRTAWDTTTVSDGDRVEVLTATQGG